MPLQRHERLSRQIADVDADVDMEQFRSESATPAHFDGLPVTATQAVVLAIQDSIQPQDDLGVAAPLITPSPQQDDGSRLKKRAVVVTVTQTQELSGGNAGGSSNSSTQTVPLGIIIGSIAVGVVIAIAVVGGWLWLSKRKRQNQKRHLRPPPRSYPTGSNRPLIPGEKGHIASPAKARTADYSYQSKTAATPVKSLAFPSEAKSNEPRAVPVPAATASSTSAIAATTTSPTKKSFAPIKSSPLSGGKKAEPSSRGNEWAKPISPPTTTDGHTGGNNLGVPGGANGDRRVSVASAESHYDDDDGYNHNR